MADGELNVDGLISRLLEGNFALLHATVKVYFKNSISSVDI